MKLDLHCHSHYSDGKCSPAFLMQRGLENNLTHLAITDHDCVDGLREVPASSESLHIVAGVEISCVWESIEIHLVGLLIDPEDPTLSGLLARQQLARHERVCAMDKRLEVLGTKGLMAYLEALPCIAYTRSHVADFLVEKRLSKSRQKAFKSYLAKRGKIYVAANWCSLAQAVDAIESAGGISVIAHPGRYPLNRKKLARLVHEFKICGGDALEMSYPNIDLAVMKNLQSLAMEEQLLVSMGSDFHDPGAHWTDIGKLPGLDQKAKEAGVWHHPRWVSKYPI